MIAQGFFRGREHRSYLALIVDPRSREIREGADRLGRAQPARYFRSAGAGSGTHLNAESSGLSPA